MTENKRAECQELAEIIASLPEEKRQLLRGVIEGMLFAAELDGKSA